MAMIPAVVTEERPPDVFDEIEGKHVADVTLSADDAWPRLLDILEEEPTEGNMGATQDRVRRLFALMEACGFAKWGNNGLHAAILKSHQAEHLADLKRASLDLFVTKAFEKAEGLARSDGDDK
jgi:hypothetical protein